MKIYIATFDRDEDAQEIARELSKIGIRTEVKPFLNIEIERHVHIEGKLSELKEKYLGTAIEGVIRKWRKYINIAKAKMEEGIEERRFEEEVLNEIMPERKILPSIEEIIGKEKIEEFRKASAKEKRRIIDELFSKTDHDIIERIAWQFERDMDVILSIHDVLKMNGIEYRNGKMYGKIPDDPLLRIYLEIEGDIENLGLEEKYELQVYKEIDVYANFIDAFYEVKKLEKLCEREPYFVELLAIVDVIAEMLDKIKGKMNLEEFIEKVMNIKRENDAIFLTREAIEEILKALEKEEIIKIKKGMIKLEKK